jgi:uncharacterized protein YbgA (DUF1722 family)/uncharacterized protein YbbK (DUF523 family)
MPSILIIETQEQSRPMRCFLKPKIVISKCIEFDHCRYDGSMISSEFVQALKPHVDFIPVCAEVEIGLGIPRDTIRLVSVAGEVRLMQPGTNLDITDRMNDFSRGFLSGLPEVDGFILKFRSPSCGLKDVKVYSAIGRSEASGKAAGFFGGAAIKAFPDLAIEDEGRLRNFNIREHFLTKLYALARLREVIHAGKVSALHQFQEANKLLLTAHSQKESSILGDIAANRQGLDFAEQSILYREHLARALRFPPRASSKANVFLHCLGYFKDKLTPEEKKHFLETVERFKNKKVHSSALLALLQSWIARYGQSYLKGQTLFEPYPVQLVELCQDSQCEWAGEALFRGREDIGSCTHITELES